MLVVSEEDVGFLPLDEHFPGYPTLYRAVAVVVASSRFERGKNREDFELQLVSAAGQ